VIGCLFVTMSCCGGVTGRASSFNQQVTDSTPDILLSVLSSICAISSVLLKAIFVWQYAEMFKMFHTDF